MTQNGPISTECQTNEGPARFGFGPQYVVCRHCVKRFKAVAAEPGQDEPRCDCGARLQAYEAPAELDAAPRGVSPRLIRFWRAGREDGYWDEKRFFRSAAAERAGVAPRQARFAYESGRRVGERLREGAHLHALRVMKMKAAHAAGTATRPRAA